MRNWFAAGSGHVVMPEHTEYKDYPPGLVGKKAGRAGTGWDLKDPTVEADEERATVPGRQVMEDLKGIPTDYINILEISNQTAMCT